MSDFDREAERERLREKYEHDQEKRQSTQRMSELLLKGATMTNRHCEECGDPIFRYEGTEFCPTCQHDGTVEGGDAAAGDDAGDAAADRPDAGGAAGATPGASRDDGAAPDGTPGDDGASGAEWPGTDAVEGSPAAGTGEDEPTATGAAAASGGEQGGGETTAPGAGDTERSGRPPAAGRRAPTRAPSGDDEGSGSDAVDARTTARASLERTLVRFAREAEGTDDPGRARDHLAAAREAAEALAALDRR